MDGSAIKEGLELNDSGDADIRKASSIMGRIYVEGYDTSLSGYDFILSMKQHFASCGEMIHVYLPGYGGCLTLYRFALVYLRGEDAEEKALKLSGSYIGGHKLVVKPYPFHANHLDLELAPMRGADNQRQHRIFVRGYDTSLPLDYVEIMLMKHFSKCGGHILGVTLGEKTIGVLRSEAYIHVLGEDTVEKALQLCGCDWDGLENIEVYGVSYPAEEECRCDVMPSWCSSPSTSSSSVVMDDATAALPKPWEALVDNETGELYFWNPESNVSQFERPRPSSLPEASPAPVFFSSSSIREAPQDPNLPKQWKVLVDSRAGCLLFWNQETNVVQFERPKPSAAAPLISWAQPSPGSSSSAPPTPSAAPVIFSAFPNPPTGPVPSWASTAIYGPEDPKLPKPWKTLVNSRIGFLYFWNPESNASQYERPPARPIPGVVPEISSAQAYHYGYKDPNLPKPWSSNLDGETGYMYFWNPETGVSQYERPPSSAPYPPNAPEISWA